MACLPFLLVVITGTSAVTITQDPPVLSIPEGQSAVMSCEMRGSENRQNLHYYWNLNNTNPDHILKNTTRVTIMSSTLIISPVTADDTGTYICTAWDYNNLHIYQETGTRLLVQEASAVSIIQDPPVLSIPEGQSAVLSCEMRGAENHQTHHYYWNLNNTNPDHILKNTTRVTIMSNILIISPVTANDTGTYICTVRDFNQHFYQGIGAHLLVQGSDPRQILYQQLLPVRILLALILIISLVSIKVYGHLEMKVRTITSPGERVRIGNDAT